MLFLRVPGAGNSGVPKTRLEISALTKRKKVLPLIITPLVPRSELSISAEDLASHVTCI